MYSPIKLLARSWDIPEEGPFETWLSELDQHGYVHKFTVQTNLSVYALREFLNSEFRDREMEPWTFVILRHYMWWYHTDEENAVVLLFTNPEDAIYARLIVF